MRAAIILLIIIATLFLVFELHNRNVGAQDVGGIEQVLQNQKLIMEKLDVMDKKLDRLKTRIY